MKIRQIFLAFSSTFLFAIELVSSAKTDGEGGFYIAPSVNKSLKFIENKGQWHDAIHFTAELPGGKIYIQKDAFTYAFYNTNDIQNIHPSYQNPKSYIIRSHVFRVEFIDANTESISGMHPFLEYHNYFIGNDKSKWASNVKLYNKITYNGIFPSIDMNLYGEDHNLKYEYILIPGADANAIQMRYRGVDKLYVKYGNLHIVTSVNQIIEQKPYAYQVVNGVEREIPCYFVLEDNIVSFSLPGGYDKDLPLIIDPKLIFSTFSGSTADNWGFTATFDPDGNLYAGGIAFEFMAYINSGSGTGTYPTTVGAFQDTFAGGYTDIAISKYDPSGANMIYSTYLGGSDSDVPHSLIVNANGELLILGTTGSNDFPTTTGAYDTTFNGGSPISNNGILFTDGSDIIIAKLNVSGTALLASTFIGGSANDGFNQAASTRYNYGDQFRGEIITDLSGNCYITSTTNSTDFPAVNALQPVFGGGFQDGCVFKLNPDLTTLLWSTYLGGINDDAAYSLQFDRSNDLYICGGTNSPDFPTTAGVLDTSLIGGTDGFITHITNNGSGIIASTYIGTPVYDQTFFVQLDTNNNVYVLGQTLGSYPVIPDSSVGTIYFNPGGKQFIHKLNDSLNATIFSTVYGSGDNVPDISPSAFLVNTCENIFVSGWGGNTGGQPGNTFGLPTTSNAFQSTTDGSDFHLLVLFKDAVTLLYATFFGGPISREHVDGGTSRFDKNGIVYQSVCGGCGSLSDFPTTPGVWSNTNNSSNCNNAAFKFDMSDIAASFFTLNSPGCVPATVIFNNTSTGGLTFFWDFGDSTTSTQFDTSHTYQDTGTYQVMLVVTDSTTCRIRDTVYAIVTVNPLPITVVSPDIAICPGASTVLNASGGIIYNWMPPGSLSCTICPNPIATPDSTTTYYVNVTDINGCVNSDSVIVSIYPLPTADAGLDVIICPGNPVTLSASGGIGYLWSPAATLSNSNIPNPIATPVVTTEYIVIVTDTNGCSNTDTVIVSLSDSIIAVAGPDISICEGSDTMLLATGGANYVWTPSTGLSNPFIANPVASPSVTTTYTVNVSSGTCFDNDTIVVTVIPLPIASAGADQSICIGDSAILTASGAAYYLWSTGDTVATITVTPDTTTIYMLMVMDVNACSDIDSVMVVVNPLPIADAGTDTTICEGENLTLIANGGVSFIWSTGDNVQAISVSPVSPTDYSVIVIDVNGCEDRDTVMVAVISIPQASFSISGDEGCDPLTVEFTNSSTPQDLLSYFWDFGDGTTDTVANPVHIYTPAGVYLVRLTISNEVCNGDTSMTATASITVNFIPTAGFSVTPQETSIFDPVVTFSDSSTGGLNCMLIPGDGDTLNICNTTYVYSDTGTFTAMQIVFNSLGCADTAILTVRINARFAFFIPNAFTPNGDGINEQFFGRGIGIREYEMFIYNRWGDEIFETDNLNAGWDGTANEGTEIVQQDVYVYVVNIIDVLGMLHRYVGIVTMVR